MSRLIYHRRDFNNSAADKGDMCVCVVMLVCLGGVNCRHEIVETKLKAPVSVQMVSSHVSELIGRANEFICSRAKGSLSLGCFRFRNVGFS